MSHPTMAPRSGIGGKANAARARDDAKLNICANSEGAGMSRRLETRASIAFPVNCRHSGGAQRSPESKGF